MMRKRFIDEELDANIFSYNFKTLKERIDDGDILLRHPLQRNNNRWDKLSKSKFVVRSIWNERHSNLTFVREYEDKEDKSSVELYIIDGLQRCTTAIDFINNEFKISKSIKDEDACVYKRKSMRDEKGNIVKDQYGRVVYNEELICDVRGKYFSELPEEIQKRFLDCRIDYLRYECVDREETARIIEMCNDARPMNPSEKGIIRLPNQAEIINDLSEHHFLCDNLIFTDRQMTNGINKRVIMENLVYYFHKKDWKKDMRYITNYISKLDITELSKELKSVMDELNNVSPFNTKNGEDFDILKYFFSLKTNIIWMYAFKMFKRIGVENIKFMEFMREFYKNYQYNEDEDGFSYCSFNERYSSKNEPYLDKKLSYITNAMCKYFNLEELPKCEMEKYESLDEKMEEIAVDMLEDEKIKDIFSDGESLDKNKLLDNIEDCKELVAECSMGIEIDSNMLSEESLKALFYLAAYSIKNKMSNLLCEWIDAIVETGEQNLNDNRYDLYNYYKNEYNKFVETKGWFN